MKPFVSIAACVAVSLTSPAPAEACMTPISPMPCVCDVQVRSGCSSGAFQLQISSSGFIAGQDPCVATGTARLRVAGYVTMASTQGTTCCVGVALEDVPGISLAVTGVRSSADSDLAGFGRFVEDATIGAAWDAKAADGSTFAGFMTQLTDDVPGGVATSLELDVAFEIQLDEALARASVGVGSVPSIGPGTPGSGPTPGAGTPSAGADFDLVEALLLKGLEGAWLGTGEWDGRVLVDGHADLVSLTGWSTGHTLLVEQLTAASTNGPRLRATGVDGDVTVRVSSVLADAEVSLVVGSGMARQPLADGVLLPWPEWVMPLVADSTGQVELAWALPEHSGVELFMQAWCLDGAACASEGLRVALP